MKHAWTASGLLALLTLAGCMDPLQVQRDYVADRDSCRARSEGQIGIYTGSDAAPAAPKDRNTLLLQLFCECMKGHDWNVAGCPKSKEVASRTPPVMQGAGAAATASGAAHASGNSSPVIVIQAQPPAPPGPIVIVPGSTPNPNAP